MVWGRTARDRDGGGASPSRIGAARGLGWSSAVSITDIIQRVDTLCSGGPRLMCSYGMPCLDRLNLYPSSARTCFRPVLLRVLLAAARNLGTALLQRRTYNTHP